MPAYIYKLPPVLRTCQLILRTKNKVVIDEFTGKMQLYYFEDSADWNELTTTWNNNTVDKNNGTLIAELTAEDIQNNTGNQSGENQLVFTVGENVINTIGNLGFLRRWTYDPDTNLGFLLVCNGTNKFLQNNSFYSNEYHEPMVRPELVIEILPPLDQFAEPPIEVA